MSESIPTLRKKGAIETLYSAPPDGSAVICLDQLGLEAAKSFAGCELVQAQPESVESELQPAERATQEIDDGRRGKDYIFCAFEPATGEALTQPYARRTTANWIDFLDRVERWEFVFQPKYAAYLNLIEP